MYLVSRLDWALCRDRVLGGGVTVAGAFVRLRGSIERRLARGLEPYSLCGVCELGRFCGR